jgi:mono/diheme cytochrome c family protein
MERGRKAVAACCCAIVATTATGCSLSSEHANLVNGKKLFLSRCGSCHTLARAGTKGTAG